MRYKVRASDARLHVDGDQDARVRLNPFAWIRDQKAKGLKAKSHFGNWLRILGRGDVVLLIRLSDVSYRIARKAWP
jgi:hypothetical protein